MYDKRERFTQLLLGPEYILLRPEFLDEPEVREHPLIGRKVLVTMGGSDPDNVTGQVLTALGQVKEDFEARVVVGAGNRRQAELQAAGDRLAPRITLEHDPPNMAPLMRWADVAISGAGSTCWELAYMGLPSIVIALSADQQGIAQVLAEREIAISLGWHANLSEKRISDALVNLLNDQELRRTMGERSRNLVDGKGAARVVQVLQSSL
jgi:UDP-2,4-diacetamido-2,4,6-trideoxy-beta-L-altropyranose hydrolase